MNCTVHGVAQSMTRLSDFHFLGGQYLAEFSDTVLVSENCLVVCGEASHIYRDIHTGIGFKNTKEKPVTKLMYGKQ